TAPQRSAQSDSASLGASDDASGRLVLWLAPLWLTGSTLYIAWPAVGHLALGVVYRKRTAVADTMLAEMVLQLTEQFGIRRRVRVIECERLKTPVAFSVLRPTIGLPKGFASTFDLRQQKAILAHELAHLALRDPAWQLVAKSAVAVLWWHPLVWW